MKRIGILTSGGDAPGMNAAIRAVVRAGIENNLQVMGINRGFSGLLNGEVFEMNRRSVSDIIHKGGTMLKTARSEEFKTEEGRERGIKVLKVFGIDGLVIIGGDGSFRGAQYLSKAGVATVGIPATIDNDLAYTDYTIGFDTAQNTVLDAINKIRDTSSSHQRVSIVEVMGRNCGDIAIFTGIGGGAEKIIIPEKGFDLNELCKVILEGKARGKMHNLIIVAEGIGGSMTLATQVEELTGIEARATILGHIQRGGSPSSLDRIIASVMGAKSIELLLNGKTSRLLGVKNGAISDFDIDEALSVEKRFNEYLYGISDVLSR